MSKMLSVIIPVYNTKEELDKCSTCDLCAAVNDGLSDESKSQLKDRTGEEIVDADIAAQMRQ